MKHILFVLLISGLLPACAESAKAPPTKAPSLANPDANAEWTAKLKKNITVEFKECAFADVIEFLRKMSDVNFIVIGKPDATVTLSLKNMPLEQVVGYLAALTGMEATVEKNAVVFRPKAAGAGTGSDNYKMETLVESAGPQQYLVAVKIQQSPDGKNWDVLSAPKITVKAGQEGKIEVKDEKTGDGIECTVLVSEIAAGTVEMSVACKVKETGKPQWQSELKARIKLP